MKAKTISISALFLCMSTTVLLAQNTQDTLKGEKKIDEVKIIGTSKKGSESNIISVQRKSVEVIERVGSAQLSKQGVGDAATAVTKATGTLKQEGSGQIFVRGLGDRYNATTLNGLEIPSENPENKNVNLEIFKTSMIEYLSLDKVYNPRFSGDFGGANINIVSREHVGKPYFKIGIGSSINLQTFDNGNFKLQDGGPGFFGFKESTYIKGNPNLAGAPYPFTTKWNFKNAKNPFNSNLNIEGGRTFGKFSFFGYAGFDNAYEYSEGQEGFYFTDRIVSSNYENVKRSYYETNTTALINLDFKLNSDNKFKFTSNYIHSSQQDAKIYTGFNNDVSQDVIINRGDNKLTDTWINQLSGSHKLGGKWTGEWAVGYNKLDSKRPDRLQNTINAGSNTLIASSAISNHRYFDDLNDGTVLGHIYLTRTFADKYKVNFGYDGSYKDRNFEQTTIGLNSTASTVVNPEDIDAYINPGNRDSFTYNVTRSTYTMKRNIQSGFANIDINFSDRFVVQVGGRYDYVNFDNAWQDILDTGKKNQTYNKILPAVNAKYMLDDRQNLRIAASKTYTLPQAKELIPIAYYDVTTNVIGNPNLYASDNYNVDLKWELFPKSGEVISLTGFGKYIQNAIARTTFSSASPDMTYFNVANWGYIIGAEFEIRKDIYKFNNSKIYAFINATYMHSKQELKNEFELAKENGGKTAIFSGQETDDIQGVADLLANANLGYNYKWNANNTFDFVISYSRTGKNLYAIGTNNIGNFYELARNVLDLNLNLTLSNYSIGISAKNLLNPRYKIEQTYFDGSSSFIHKDYTRGRQVGLNLSYKF